MGSQDRVEQDEKDSISLMEDETNEAEKSGLSCINQLADTCKTPLQNYIESSENVTQQYMTNPSCYPIEGLTYIPNFLTKEEQIEIMRVVDSNPFSEFIHRRQQFYGPVYYHTSHDLDAIQPPKGSEMHQGEKSWDIAQLQWVVDKLQSFGVFPSSDGEDDEPWQILVNEYLNNDGIAVHFDDEKAFGKVITSLSLLDPIYMILRKPKIPVKQCNDIVEETKIYLAPGSLLILRDATRKEWKHGVTRARIITDPVTGDKIRRQEGYRRISLTVRHLLDGRKGYLK